MREFSTLRILGFVWTLFGSFALHADPSAATTSTNAIEEARVAMKKFTTAPGLEIALYASEPLMRNPVSFAFDEKGRCYVVETHRRRTSIHDIRRFPEWVDTDFSFRTVADRYHFMTNTLRSDVTNSTARVPRDYNNDGVRDWHDLEVESEGVRQLVDEDRDGAADRAISLPGEFKTVVSGGAAGVLARGSNVWFTCIPDLWVFTDTNADGLMDERKSLLHGFGVHIAFPGHDLHGLRFGPDGRLYFSIADRGLNVRTAEGTQVVYPDAGAVMRCNPDGTEFELVATGLRNPQELAFDEKGDLWTGDNNGDGGDKARWVYVLDGSDSGWQIGWQHVPKMGPWNAERLWELAHTNSGAYILPPVAHIGRGPAGITYYPGTGLGPRYDKHFFMTDFPGGVRSFAIEPKNGFYEVADLHDFFWGLFPVDCDFGPHRGLYVADWIEGWEKTGKGRIYRVFDPSAGTEVDEVRGLLAAGFRQRSVKQLLTLLGHRDQRIRQEAQFALADRGAAVTNDLFQVVRKDTQELKRVHALWALGQRGRTDLAALNMISIFASDNSAEVRAQTMKTLGEWRRGSPDVAAVAQALFLGVEDPVPRVRMFAMQSLGRVAPAGASEAIINSFRATGQESILLRHAAAAALARLKNLETIAAAAEDPNREVRLLALLVLRRMESPAVARFLYDADPQLVLEAARAINDLNITDSFPQLAALLGRTELPQPALRRALNVHYRLGQTENALAIAGFVENSKAPETLRADALNLLANWQKPAPRDWVVGLWRPLPQRDLRAVSLAMRARLPALIQHGSAAIQAGALKLAALIDAQNAAPTLAALVRNEAAEESLRVEALKTLASLKAPDLEPVMKFASASSSSALRAEAARWENRGPAGDLNLAITLLQTGGIREKQQAFTLLGSVAPNGGDALLTTWLDKLSAGEVAPELQLDIINAAEARAQASRTIRRKLQDYHDKSDKRDVLAGYRETLKGGNAETGRKLFFERADAGCLRCHKVKGEGGEVGPELAGIASRQSRDLILESILFPNNVVAPGFETTILSMKDGTTHTGLVQKENSTEVVMNSPEDGVLTIKKSEIESRDKGLSSMPEELGKLLTRSELRDLIEYLATLK